MIMLTEDRNRQSDERLRLKTQNDTLMREAMAGAGLTRWEAQALPEVVEEIYFSQGGDGPLRDGQILYQCTAISEGPGKALAECSQVQVRLTVLDVVADREVRRDHGLAAARRQVLCRITEESREQGGLLTQEDAAFLLHASERTIRRDVAELASQGIHVATRGFLKDIGPSVSHKGVALRHWFGGSEPVDVARAINHSVRAVERYLGDFRRVAFGAMQDFDQTTIARITRLSSSLVATYLAIYQEFVGQQEHAYRFDEIRMLEAPEPNEKPEQSDKKGELPIPCPSVNANRTKSQEMH